MAHLCGLSPKQVDEMYLQDFWRLVTDSEAYVHAMSKGTQ